ncbi:MAG: fumarylacetoacetate hydrolase family protein [Proteobacteria bacterium]|nr:fumarylacetoacetate hydrolase family protein [Pseudomonadota bacterium]
MSSYVLPARVPSVAVAGEAARFPVRRIYCVGFNYAEHNREMGRAEREPPIFFSKPADAVLADGADLPYPARTANFHYEAELVVAIGRGGAGIPAASARDHVYGYAVGNDYTRRDLQAAAKSAGRPWDTAKGLDHGAGIGAIHAAARIGHPTRAALWLTVNGVERQRGDIADMIWDVPGIIAELSTFFELQPGDLIYTGTPAGVGPVRPGDVVVAGIDGLGTLTHRIVAVPGGQSSEGSSR